MPFFEVKLIAVCVVCVEAPDAGAALDAAAQEATPDDYEFAEGSVGDAVRDDAELDSIKRHANLCIEA